MQVDKKTKARWKVYERREKLRKAAHVLVMWKKFLGMQVLASARHHAYTGCVVKLSEDKIISSKCLNETRRAVFVKLEAATLLASVGPPSTWLVCYLEPSFKQ